MGKMACFTAEEEFGGNLEALRELRIRISCPFLFPREAVKLGLRWPRGCFVFGQPGCGKTTLVSSVAHECKAHLTIVRPSYDHSCDVEKIEAGFLEASSCAMSGKPSILLIKELHKFFPIDTEGEENDFLLWKFLTLLKAHKPLKTYLPLAIILSANSVVEVDPKVRRTWCFASQIQVTQPNVEERIEILQIHTRLLSLDSRVCLRSIASSPVAYSGADLQKLVDLALLNFQRRSAGAADRVCLTMDDFLKARTVIDGGARRGVMTSEIPKVSWDDIGGLDQLKEEIKFAVILPIKKPDLFLRTGTSPIRGLILHGPPGCSKTMLAKATATDAGVSYFSLSGAEIYSKYVGEGEAILRNIFELARQASPSIILLDEFDSMAPSRDSDLGTNSIGGTLVSTFLTEMDGLEETKSVIVLATTNRLDAVDPAVLRSGRMDMIRFVPPPDTDDRLKILSVCTRAMKLGNDVDLARIAGDTDMFTGAELTHVCWNALLESREESCASEPPLVCDHHFRKVLRSFRPSLTPAELAEYSSYSSFSRLKQPS